MLKHVSKTLSHIIFYTSHGKRLVLFLLMWPWCLFTQDVSFLKSLFLSCVAHWNAISFSLPKYRSGTKYNIPAISSAVYTWDAQTKQQTIVIVIQYIVQNIKKWNKYLKIEEIYEKILLSLLVELKMLLPRVPLRKIQLSQLYGVVSSLFW